MPVNPSLGHKAVEFAVGDFVVAEGALRGDGSGVPNSWNRQPAPLGGPLVVYWQATVDDNSTVRLYRDIYGRSGQAGTATVATWFSGIIWP